MKQLLSEDDPGNGDDTQHGCNGGLAFADALRHAATKASAATTAQSGTAKENTKAFQFVAKAFAGRARNEMDETSVAKIESPIAQLGTLPPPATNPAVPFADLLK